MGAEKPRINEELRHIPGWAYALAFLFFVSILVLLPFAFRRVPNPPPFPLVPFITLTAGAVVAFYILLVGYVNRDAKRRNMNSALWTVLVIFIPNAIGFIIYFLLRQPLIAKCPQCSAQVHPNFNYCPHCKYSLRPTCPKCAHAVRPGDAFCPQCAYELKGASAG